jgi:hypothetical protein
MTEKFEIIKGDILDLPDDIPHFDPEMGFL